MDLDISEISPQGPDPVSENHIPTSKESTERVLSPTVAKSSNLPTISVTKVPAPLPVRLPTARDIVSLPSPPPSQNPSLEDLESGRVDGMREVAEDVGLFTSTRKTGKAKSSHHLDGSDPTASAIPTSPSPLISPTTSPAVTSATFQPNFPAVPDLLADLPSIGKETIEPSPLEDPLLNPDTSRDNLLVETTIRLVGGGGQAHAAEIPVASSLEEEQPPSESTKDADVVTISPSEVEAETKPDEKSQEKSHKKSKSSLASLKKLGQLGRTIKRDSMSSIKSIISQQNT